MAREVVYSVERDCVGFRSLACACVPCMRDEFGDCIVGEYTGGAPRWLDGEQRLCDVPEEEQEEFWAGVVAMSAEYACL
jgi:hypothetical protein